MIKIIIFLAIIILVIYLINYDNRLFKIKSKESFNDFGKCSDSSNIKQNTAYILGKVGIAPWGECPGFKDQNAEWIWFTPKGEKNAPGENFGDATFFYNWFNSNSFDTEAKINIIVDNKSHIKLNNLTIGEQKGGAGTSGGLFNVNLKPGKNTFSFTSTNFGNNPNPGGLLVTVVDDLDQILFSTGSGWTYSKRKSMNQRITNSHDCTRAGGTKYHYCHET